MCCVDCSRPFAPWGRARFVAWVAATFSKLNPNSCQGPKRSRIFRKEGKRRIKYERGENIYRYRCFEGET
jgi:hypothetical protein